MSTGPHCAPIFDRLCKAIEANVRMIRTGLRPSSPSLGRLLNDLRECALFVVEKPLHEVLPTEYEKRKLDWLRANLYLPFPTVAIEDPGSLCLFSDNPGVVDRDVVRGAGVLRAFIEVQSADKMVPSNYEDGPRSSTPITLGGPLGSVVLSTGMIRITDMTEKQLVVDGGISLCVLLTADGYVEKVLLDLLDPVNQIEDRDMERAILRNVCASLQELCVLIDPDNYILQSTPRSAIRPSPTPPRKGRLTRVYRSTERPIYTVLKAKEIRERLGLPEPDLSSATGDSRRPHRRRAHVRRLMSERFTHKHGQTTIVRSCWIGPHERVVGNRIYKVILDH